MISGIIRKNNDDYIFKINRYISYVDIEKANNMSKEDVELIKTEEEKIPYRNNKVYSFKVKPNNNCLIKIDNYKHVVGLYCNCMEFLRTNSCEHLSLIFKEYYELLFDEHEEKDIRKISSQILKKYSNNKLIIKKEVFLELEIIPHIREYYINYYNKIKNYCFELKVKIGNDKMYSYNSHQSSFINVYNNQSGSCYFGVSFTYDYDTCFFNKTNERIINFINNNFENINRNVYSLQTNGTLLNTDNIDFFKANSTNIGLSFDGLTNDKTRSYTQKILENIKLLQSNGMYPGAILVVNQNNVNNLIGEYEYFKSLNLGMKMNPMFNDGAAKENNFFDLDPNEYIKNFVEFFKYWSLDATCNINVSTCIELVNLVLNEKSSVCTFNSCLGKWLCFDSDGHLYPCDRLCLEEYDLGDVTRMASIEEAFENKNFLKLLQNSISRRQNCIENCEYFKNCYGGCNANSILNEKNKNSVSCHIQKGILKEIKKFIIELNNEKEYDKLNYSLSKVLIKRSIKR